ncbi:hypothetical protein [Stenotrophomonas sp. NRRL B-14846]|uniref:hypothetical protein n=1 Tax=Stenotrophomonas sp. NRRL B-14846 TaxID=3162882 RepID=UPI003D279752
MSTENQIRRLDRKVRRWIKQWPENTVNRELFLIEPFNTISEYLGSKGYHYGEPYTALGDAIDHDEDVPSESGYFYARLNHERLGRRRAA